MAHFSNKCKYSNEMESTADPVCFYSNIQLYNNLYPLTIVVRLLKNCSKPSQFTLISILISGHTCLFGEL